MTRGPRDPGSEFEVRLDNRRIFLLAFTALALAVLAFAVGYVVGRRSGWVTAGEGRLTTVAPPVALPAAPPPGPAEPAATPASSLLPSIPDVPAVPATAPPAPTPTRAAVPTPPPAPAAAPATAPPRGGWSVQVAAYGDRAQAGAAAEGLRAKGRPSFVVEPAKGETRRLWRVRVGPFPSKAAAESAAASLRKDGFKDPLVRGE